MCCGNWLLTIIINSLTISHLTRIIIMNTCGVIIAVCPLRLIVWVRHMNTITYNIATMNLPSKTRPKSLIACHRHEWRHFIVPHTSVGISIKNTKQNTINIISERFAHLLQSISTKPVVTIHKTNVIACGMRQSNIAGMGLSSILF